MTLRQRVGEEAPTMYEEDAEVEGIKVKHMVESTHGTIESYVRHIQGNQWASIVELYGAAKSENISFWVLAKNTSVKMGLEKAKFAMVLRNNHYVLKNVYAGLRYLKKGQHMERGGMQSAWTWSTDTVSEEDEPLPAWAWSTNLTTLEMQRGERVHVEVAVSLRSDVTNLSIHPPREARVAALKVRLVDILGVPRARMVILRGNGGRELPDWSYVPENVVVDDVLAVPIAEIDYITVLVSPLQQEVVLPVPEGMGEDQIRATLARLIGYPVQEVLLTGRDGEAWSYRTSRPLTSYVVLSLRDNCVQRGGMDDRWAQRSRSRSPTGRTTHRSEDITPTEVYLGEVMYREQSSSSSSPQASAMYREMEERFQRERLIREALREELRNEPCVRSPSPRPVVEQHDYEEVPARAHLWSRIGPETPPPAQPIQLQRPIYVNDEVIGVVRAAYAMQPYLPMF